MHRLALDTLDGLCTPPTKTPMPKSRLQRDPLDAIFLISGISNPKLPLNINIIRNYRRLEPSDMKLDFYSLDMSNPIVIKAENDETRELQISVMESSSSKIDLLGEDNNVASTDPDNKYGLILKYKI